MHIATIVRQVFDHVAMTARTSTADFDPATLRRKRFVDWRDLTTMLVGSILFAIGAAAVGVLVKASESTWGILIATATLIVVVAWLARLERLTSRVPATAQRDISSIRAQLALAEARQYLASQAGIDDHNVWEDAVAVFAGAILSGWTVECSTKGGHLAPTGLSSPPVGGHSVTWSLLLPLNRRHVDATAKFLIAHGAPIERIRTEAAQLPVRRPS